MSWIEEVREALLGLDVLETVRDYRLVIEVVEIADDDSLRVDLLSTPDRQHHTRVRTGIAIYQRGFDPPLTAVDAARLVCQALSEPSSRFS